MISAGVLPAEAWRLVEASDSALVEAWRTARAAYDREEPGWRQAQEVYQRDRGIPRRRVPSPHGRAEAVAEAAVAEKLEGMLTGGQIVYAGFRGGELGDDPEIIPLELLAGRRPRGSRITVRGTVFHDVRLYPAEALASTEPEGEAPPATLARLAEVLGALFGEDPAWAVASTVDLAKAVAIRDPRFRPHQGPAKAGRWSEATLRQRIRETRVEARALAGL